MRGDRACGAGSVLRSLAVLAVAGVAAVGCSNDEASTTSASDDAGVTSPSATSAPTTVSLVTSAPTASTIGSPIASTVEPPATATAPVETIATVPEEGVPGLDSDDAFCRGWGEFAGSFQALAFASALDTDGAARLEVIAAATVIGAARTIDDGYPESIAVERADFVDGVLGPFERRAQQARADLLAAGLSEAETEQLGDAWLAALAAAGVDEPEIMVDVPPSLDAAVTAAATVFAASVPAIGADPSLVTDTAAPSTFEYLAANCPDQGILAGNDAVG